MGHRNEPAAECVVPLDSLGAFHECHERRLKGVFHIGTIKQYLSTDAQNRAFVSMDDFREGSLIGVGEIAVEQLPVGREREVRINDPQAMGNSCGGAWHGLLQAEGLHYLNAHRSSCGTADEVRILELIVQIGADFATSLRSFHWHHVSVSTVMNPR